MAKLLWHQCVCAEELLGLGKPRHREVEENELCHACKSKTSQNFNHRTSVSFCREKLEWESQEM